MTDEDPTDHSDTANSYVDEFDDDVTVSARPSEPALPDVFDDDATRPAAARSSGAGPTPADPTQTARNVRSATPPLIAGRQNGNPKGHARPPSNYSAGGAAGERGAMDRAWPGPSSRTPAQVDKPTPPTTKAPVPSPAPDPAPGDPSPVRAPDEANRSDPGTSIRDRIPAPGTGDEVSWTPPHARSTAPIQVSSLDSSGPSWGVRALAIAIVAMLAMSALWYFVLRESAPTEESAYTRSEGTTARDTHSG